MTEIPQDCLASFASIRNFIGKKSSAVETKITTIPIKAKRTWCKIKSPPRPATKIAVAATSRFLGSCSQAFTFHSNGPWPKLRLYTRRSVEDTRVESTPTVEQATDRLVRMNPADGLA